VSSRTFELEYDETLAVKYALQHYVESLYAKYDEIAPSSVAARALEKIGGVAAVEESARRIERNKRFAALKLWVGGAALEGDDSA
jgi:hypothetical protein